MSRQTLWIGVVLIAGLLAGFYIVGADKNSGDSHGHDGGSDTPAAHEAEGHQAETDDHASEAGAKKAPHGGRLFTEGSYGLELTIFERGVQPQFRIYTYEDGKPLDPVQSTVSVTLERLGREPQRFSFRKESDYLKGDAVVEEPHSFAVTIEAQHAGKLHRFAFEQIEARVTMSDAQLESNGVRTATAGPARIATTLKLIGEVRLNEDRTVRIVPRLGGVVASAPASAGDRVRKGQVLAVVSSQELADQRSELLAARKRVALARTTFEREKQLWQEKISAKQDYLQARQALQEAEIVEQSARQKLASLGTAVPAADDLTRYEIKSPIDGAVVDKAVSVGEVVKEDAGIFVVADLSTVWVDMTVYAKDLNVLKTGQRATVKATDFDAEAAGTISWVGSVVGDQTRTAKARLVLPNPQGLWRPGLPVTVDLVANEVEVPVAIEADAVQTLGESTVVFGRYGEQFEARPIELGRSDDKRIEVLGGLNAGESYAARNSYLIKADIGKSGASHDH